MGRWFPIAKRGVAMNLKAATLTYLAIEVLFYKTLVSIFNLSPKKA